MVGKNLILQILTIILRIKTSGSDPESNPRSFHLPGDILLGGLFPVHESEKSGDSFCKDTIQFSRGIQRVEAMKYAIEKLQNKVVHRLLNVKVGALIKDTCGSPAYAQKQSLDFIMASLSRTVSGKFVYVADPSQKPEPYPAVIGASSSSVSIQVWILSLIISEFLVFGVKEFVLSPEVNGCGRFHGCGFFTGCAFFHSQNIYKIDILRLEKRTAVTSFVPK